MAYEVTHSNGTIRVACSEWNPLEPTTVSVIVGSKFDCQCTYRWTGTPLAGTSARCGIHGPTTVVDVPAVSGLSEADAIELAEMLCSSPPVRTMRRWQ